MSEWLQDLSFGVRMMATRPGTSAVAVVALALGIGLTTTMFSIVEGVILRGLPFEAGDRIVHLSRAAVQQPDRRRPVTPHDFVDWQARQTTLESLAAYVDATVTVAGG